MALVDTAPLWAAFKRHGCQQARTTLIEAHAPLVDLTRRRVIPSVPATIDPEDLRSEGLIAIVKAVDRFDPARGAKFTSFCISMIQGALLEYLRKEDWAPRSTRRKQKTVTRATDSLAQAMGREPEAPELAAALGLDLEALTRLQGEARPIALVSYEQVAFAGSDDADLDPLTLAQQMVDERPGPEALALAAEERARLWQAVDWLPARKRSVIRAHYDEGVTLKTIAGRLDRSESRAHQMHWQALCDMRRYLGGDAVVAVVDGGGLMVDGPAADDEPTINHQPLTINHRGPATKEAAMVESITNGAAAVAEAPEWDGWTAAEDETLRELWGRREPNEIARKLGRTAAATKARAGSLQLGGGPHFSEMPPIDPRATWWAPEEDATLRAQWGRVSAGAIGIAVGRNRQAVHRRAKALGLPEANGAAANRRRTWTAAEDDRLRELHGRLPRREIAIQLDRTVGAISCRVEDLRLNASTPDPLPGRSLKARASAPESVAPRAALVDGELLAMAEVYRLLAGLDERARARVVRWVADRWEGV